MAFTATRREWSELYTFFHLLNEGCVALGNEKGDNTTKVIPIAYILRKEQNNIRKYYIQEKEIHVVGEDMNSHFIREDFGIASGMILNAMAGSHEEEVESPDGVEEFLDELGIYSLGARAEDGTDIQIAFYSVDAPLVGFRMFSKLGGMRPLLDGGRAANIKFEQTGVRFPSPAVSKINSLETPHEVLDRILMIERLGGQLKFSDASDKIFRSNLHLIDLHFPRMLGEMTRIFYMEDVNKVNELVERIKALNPLKIKDELIRKHGYYEYKMKEFLLAIAQGMRPAKLYNGVESSIGGMLVTDSNGEVLCYYKNERQIFADYLYNNTRFLKEKKKKDHYGYLERENGLYYLRLNVKVGLIRK